MGQIPVPDREAERLARLRSYLVLDTPPEEAFDRITRLAAHLLQMPIALVSLVDEERQWFKSSVGLDATETPRDLAFCAHAICKNGVMIVEDAAVDERFAGNSLVTGDPHIRFYAGAPLQTADGLNLGTLCTIDSRPRQLSAEQISLLQDLSRIVLDELELRREADRARQAETRLKDAVEALSDGFVLYDESDRLVMCNERYREIYGNSTHVIKPGATFEDMLRQGVSLGQYPEAKDREELWIAERMLRHRNPGEPIEQELPGDRWLRVEERRTRDGGMVGFRVDITELKRQQRRLAELAWTDSLTGALNRRRFMELGEIELRRAARHDRPVTVMLIDVDHFKQVNDNFGHAAGDIVLCALVERWKGILREHELLGRVGGEEFAVCLTDADAAGAAAVADRLRRAASTPPVQAGDVKLPVTVSIGCTSLTDGREFLEQMLIRADAALYAANEGGRDRCMVAA